MPKNIKPGDRINGYTISALLNKGAMANAFAAASSKGRKVFFKQYKSPTVTVPWYRGYVKYQTELKRRIEATRAKAYCYEIIDFFEATWGTPCYFQVFEFVEGGIDLEKNLHQLAKDPKAMSWDQRVLLAKVFMAGISAIHDAGIVHCDLKPPNIQLFKDPSITAQYHLKLIDMDYSVLSDVPAPWHGHQGYVGTAGYFSPEHLNGSAPTPASDVFTCGLILYEILASGGHPYPFEDSDVYQRAVMAHRARPPSLAGRMPAPADNAAVAAALHQALAPDIACRPAARDILLVLNGRTDAGAPAVSPPSSVPAERRGQIELLHFSGQKLRLGLRTEIGYDVCRIFGDDSRFLAPCQFTLERSPDDQWRIVPHDETSNDTLLNGRAITSPQPLRSGDLVAVGREAKGIVKLPLAVRIL